MPTKIQEYKAPMYPNAKVDYGRNWGPDSEGNRGFLNTDLEEKIIVSDWIITSDMEKTPTLVLTTPAPNISDDGHMTACFVTGGTAGVKYKLTNSITTIDNTGANREESMTGIVNCCFK